MLSFKLGSVDLVREAIQVTNTSKQGVPLMLLQDISGIEEAGWNQKERSTSGEQQLWTGVLSEVISAESFKCRRGFLRI